MKHLFSTPASWLAFLISFGSLCSIGCKRKPSTPPPPVSEAQQTQPAEPAAPQPPSQDSVSAPSNRPIPISEPEVLMPLVEFGLPTKNKALFTGPPEDYFMFVDRGMKDPVTQKIVAMQVWQGGQYGFVRDPKMLKDGSVVYSRFHEGMDVAPTQRDAKDEPMDSVFSIADGTVMFANTSAGKSNYGNYVIIRHDTPDGPFYSLSAHFREVKVTRGTKVKCGDVIGMMGHTGAGIDRRRSHTHVELNMLLNEKAAHFEDDDGPAMPTPVAMVPKPAAGAKASFKPAAAAPAAAADAPKLNGQNLVGLDVADWLRQVHDNPRMRLSEFILRTPAYFKLRIPNRGGELEIVKRYPWLRAPGPVGESWEISISASSLPLKVEPIAEKCDFPNVTWVKPFTGNHAWMCREMLTGSGTTASLSSHGNEYLKLIQPE